MALSAATVLEIRNTADWSLASDTNGGGFVTGAAGTDWSFANIPANGGPQYSVTDGVTAGSTTITSATAAFGTDVVGNLISVSGGTGSVAQNWYQIISRTNATTIVVDRLTGLTAGTGVTLKIRGALATPGQAAVLMTVSGMTAWAKYSTTSYNMTTATPGAAGPIVMPNAGLTGYCIMQGYDVTRGDRTGNIPSVSWGSVSAPGANTYIYTQTNNSDTIFANLAANGNNVAKVSGFNVSLGNRGQITGCVALNCSGTGSIGINTGVSTDTTIEYCKSGNCTIGFNGAGFSSCFSTGCTTGFQTLSGNNEFAAYKCLASGGTTGFNSDFGGITKNCTADSCSTSGFVNGGVVNVIGNIYDSCIASNISGGGGKGFTVGIGDIMMNCASYNNATEISGTPAINIGMILNASFTGGSPYVSSTDFRPNSTAGAGALLRGAGIGVFGQTDNTDIGAVQHSDPVASFIGQPFPG